MKNFSSHQELTSHESNEQRVKLIVGIGPHFIHSMYRPGIVALPATDGQKTNTEDNIGATTSNRF